MNGKAKFHISDEKVVINGHDVANHTTALRFTHVVREMPRLELEMFGDAVIEGEGIVYVSVPSPDQILRFLDEIDPAKLDTAIAENMGWGSESVGEIALQTLKELARGSTT